MANPISVRLSPEMIARLKRVADSMHLENRAAVIKLCVSSFLDDYEKGGYTTLPLDWGAILKDMDGRTHRYPEKPPIDTSHLTYEPRGTTKPDALDIIKPKKKKIR